jgi:hypothetical protein
MNKKDEKSSSEDEKKDFQMVTIRVPKPLLTAYDKTCLVGGRAEGVRTMMQEKVEKSGNQVQATVSLPDLQSKADRCRREVERLRKVMATNNTLEAVGTVALRFHPLEPENIPLIIRELRNYAIKLEDGFDRGDVEDFIEYLEVKRKHVNLLKEIDDYLKKAEIVESDSANRLSGKEKGNGKGRRYISPKDLCDCGVHETKAEHNPRCFHVADETLHGINPHLDTPLKQLQMISRFGEQHTTSAEEKAMIVEYLKEYGTTNQKALVNAYFKSHNFPVPFPECQQESLNEAAIKQSEDEEIETEGNSETDSEEA